MTRPRRPTAGRPPLEEGEQSRRRMVNLPPDLDDAAARAKGSTPWSEWLRGLVERAIRERRHTDPKPPSTTQ